MPDRSSRSARTNELVERPGDAEHLVDGPRAALDGDHEQGTPHAGATRLGRERREDEASRHVAIGEAGELDSPAVGRQNEDLLLVAIRDEEGAARAGSKGGGDRASIEDLGAALRRHASAE